MLDETVAEGQVGGAGVDFLEAIDSRAEHVGHIVKASKGFSFIGYTKMDLGIAKCHFEIGAELDKFEWA